MYVWLYNILDIYIYIYIYMMMILSLLALKYGHVYIGI